MLSELVAERTIPRRRDRRRSHSRLRLHDAALGGSRIAASVLLKRGADINARDRNSQATPLHVAASWGRRDVVELLLANGADPSVRDKNGKTPLDLAVDSQQPEIANLLRRATASVARGR